MKPTTTASIKIAALAAVLLFPISALASVAITEIMYDAPGSDSGHEWVEINNTGASSINIYGYKLFEGGTNHGISVASGTSTLAAGEVAVIANNPQTFLQDFPHYAGTIFKSSFSLSNTGESLVIEDNLLTQVEGVSYISAQGADGDGNSLHQSGDSWIPGAPNPGSTAVTTAIVKTTASAPVSKIASTKSTTSTKTKNSQEAAVGAAGSSFTMPSPPPNDTLWTTLLGLAALIVIGVGGALYVRNPKETLSTSETTPTAEEFEIS